MRCWVSWMSSSTTSSSSIWLASEGFARILRAPARSYYLPLFMSCSFPFTNNLAKRFLMLQSDFPPISLEIAIQLRPCLFQPCSICKSYSGVNIILFFPSFGDSPSIFIFYFPLSPPLPLSFYLFNIASIIASSSSEHHLVLFGFYLCVLYHLSWQTQNFRPGRKLAMLFQSVSVYFCGAIFLCS